MVGRRVSATSSYRARMKRAIPSGISISRTRLFAISQGSTCTPTRTKGRTTGRKRTVRTIRSTIRPAVKAMSPFATCTSFGRKGAPAAMPVRISPIRNPSESGRTEAISSTRMGTRMKLAARESRTSRVFFRGAMICGMVRLKPIPAMLVMMKTSTPSVPMAIRNGSNCVIGQCSSRCYIALPIAGGPPFRPGAPSPGPRSLPGAPRHVCSGSTSYVQGDPEFFQPFLILLPWCALPGSSTVSHSMPSMMLWTFENPTLVSALTAIVLRSPARHMTRSVSVGANRRFTSGMKSGLSSTANWLVSAFHSCFTSRRGMLRAISAWPTKMYSSGVRTSMRWTRSGSACHIGECLSIGRPHKGAAGQASASAIVFTAGRRLARRYATNAAKAMDSNVMMNAFCRAVS